MTYHKIVLKNTNIKNWKKAYLSTALIANKKGWGADFPKVQNGPSSPLIPIIFIYQIIIKNNLIK